MVSGVSHISRPPLVIACAANEAYAMPMGVMLFSLLVNLKNFDEAIIYIISSNLSCPTVERLKRVLHATRIKVESHFEKPDTALQFVPTVGHVSTDAYSRLILPRVIPERFEKALYFDCDICVTGDVSNLWDQDIGGRALLAGVDIGIGVVSRPHGLPNYRELGLEPDHPYFNSGVLVMNLKKWREQDFGARILSYRSENLGIIRFNDQDSMNAVLARDWLRLDLRWNVDVTKVCNCECLPDSAVKVEVIRRQRELLAKPGVLHYSNIFKPWLAEHNPPKTGTWIQYLARSRWFAPSEMLHWLYAWQSTRISLKRRK